MAMNDAYAGYENVVDYGAKPNSFLDDTEAFKMALATGNGIFIPSGVYYVSDTLALENQNMIGAGPFASQIVSICTDPSKPIIRAGRTCVLADFLVKYKEGIVTGTEGEGERVAIWASGSNWPLQRGSSIRNIRIEEVGTCLYAPDDTLSPFDVLHESLELNEFSYRGIDYRARNRLGNVYINIYASSSKPHVDCLMAFENDCSEISMHQITLMHTVCHRAVLRFSGAKTFHISTLHIGDVRLAKPGLGMIEMEGSSGEIRELNVYYSPICEPGLSLVSLGNARYLTEEWAPPNLGNTFYLRIGVFQTVGLNDPTVGPYPAERRGIRPDLVKDFRFIARQPGSEGVYVVEVDHYSYYTFQDDQKQYEEFRCDDDDIVFLNKGDVPRIGPAAGRPVHRLCAGISEYYDTDAKKKWLWTGEEWI